MSFKCCRAVRNSTAAPNPSTRCPLRSSTTIIINGHSTFHSQGVERGREKEHGKEEEVIGKKKHYIMSPWIH